MRQEDLARIRTWFQDYLETYRDLDPEGFANIQLKELHTAKVVEAMAALAAGEGLSAEEARIASAVALLHDVGRFPQFRRWRTFRDSESDNHARMGVDLLREQRVLEALPVDERLLIEEAIRFHNLLHLPPRYQSPTDRYIKLIRDADKLDIWRVFVELLALPAEERPSAACLGMPDLPTLTPTAVAALAEGRTVRLDECAVLNDFRLLQISWAYDLNTVTAFRLLHQRNYLAALAEGMPECDGVRPAIQRAIDHVARQAGL